MYFKNEIMGEGEKSKARGASDFAEFLFHAPVYRFAQEERINLVGFLFRIDVGEEGRIAIDGLLFHLPETFPADL